MKILNAVMFFVSILLIQSCSDISNPSVDEISGDIIPLAVGNSWNYHITLYDTTGNVSTEFNHTGKIKGDTLIGNFIWYYFDTDAWYCSVQEDGYHTYNPYEPDSLKDQLNFKYPCAAGDKYSYYEVAKTDTQITVPAGTFSCIMYSLRTQTSWDFAYIDYFIKPGVGYIKTVDYSFTENHPLSVFSISELLSWNFNKQ